MNISSLQVQEVISKAFAGNKLLESEEITECSCERCAELKKMFTPYINVPLPDSIIKNDCPLHLCSPAAYHYFLPQYMLFCLKNEKFCASVVLETLWAVLPEKQSDNEDAFWCRRIKLFSFEQLEAVYQFIDYFKDKPVAYRQVTLIDRGKKRLHKYFSSCRE
jgi:hypothetical protein